MTHLSGNTSGVSKSSSDWLDYTGFPGDVCVAFFNIPPGNKNAVVPNPFTKEESRRVYNCQVKSSQVTFIYIALLTIQIVTKQLHNIKMGK